MCAAGARTKPPPLNARLPAPAGPGRAGPGDTGLPGRDTPDRQAIAHRRNPGDVDLFIRGRSRMLGVSRGRCACILRSAYRGSLMTHAAHSPGYRFDSCAASARAPAVSFAMAAILRHTIRNRSKASETTQRPCPPMRSCCCPIGLKPRTAPKEFQRSTKQIAKCRCPGVYGHAWRFAAKLYHPLKPAVNAS